MAIELVLLASGLNTLLPRLWEHRQYQKKKKIAINAYLDEMKLLSAQLLRAIEAPKFKGDGSDDASSFKKDARIESQKALDSIRIFYSGKNGSNTEFEEKTKRHCANMKDLFDRLDKYTPQEKATKKPEDPCATDHMAMDETVQEVLKLIELPGRQADGGRKVISIVGFPGLGKTIIAKLVYVAAAAKDAAGEVESHTAGKKHTLASSVRAWVAPAPKDAPGELARLGSKSHTAAGKKHTHTPAAYTVRARVTAGAKDASEVLRDILKEVDAHPHGEHGSLGLEKLSLEKPSLEKLSGEKLGELLTQRLRGKRYFIVIDDMQSIQQWVNMRDVFPKDGDGCGTIIVTTSIQSVANVCSHWKGYVYNLSPLDDHKSIDLFMKDRTLWSRDSVKNNASEILKKCDGLPLAIVSMSDMLEGTATGVQTSDSCRSVCAELGNYLLKGRDGLKRLQWVLMNKYTGLTCDALRSCLLYYCLYKHNMDAVPRMNSLARRWEAEGFLVSKSKASTLRDVTDQNLETLLDCNIMQPMEVGKNGRTRRCRPPGMMLEYISSISMSENFAASVSDAVPSGIRRLSAFYPASARHVQRMSDEDLKLVLTLEVSGVGCEAIPDFKKYELIAVLELKECTNLDSSHVQDICKLVLLKYLSLGNSIEEIPVAIKNLKLLETLEMRRNETVLVHEELLELPNLKHLLGMFQLGKMSNKKLKNFLSGKSGIETVTGFVTDTARGFPKLMHHMKRLRKVKIHCTPTATDEDQKDLQTKIKAFTRKGSNDTALRLSLSVDFTKFNTGIQQSRTLPLEFLQETGSLDSLKLRGDWRPFISARGQNNPGLQMMSGITKLCLSGTHLSGEVVLAGLTHFTALQFLKLEEEEVGPLEIKSGTFQVLTLLCLVGKTKLHGITIEREALPKLLSLHLICAALDPGLESSIQRGGVMALNEIAMDSQVATGIKDAWKKAAEGHPNRPRVLLIKKGHLIRQA